MAIEYIGTSDIKVFPSAFRNGDEEAKRTTEENLIKFNRLSSSAKNLDQMFFDPDDSNYVVFNIHGYWFKCLKTSIPLGNNLFAYIKLEKVAGVGWKLSAIPESALDDEEYKIFTGLGFATTVPEDVKEEGELTVKYYKLKVRDENGKIVEQKLKLTSDEIRNKNTNRSIGEELITTSIMAGEIYAGEINAGEINAEEISVTGNITANGKEVAFKADIPNAIKNPNSLIIKRNTTVLATYDGSSPKEINITSGIKQWTKFGTAPHSQGGSGMTFNTEYISEVFIVYSNHNDGKYDSLTEVVYGPVSLVHEMKLPGYLNSYISCSNDSIYIDWDPSDEPGAKSFVTVFGR